MRAVDVEEVDVAGDIVNASRENIRTWRTRSRTPARLRFDSNAALSASPRSASALDLLRPAVAAAVRIDRHELDAGRSRGGEHDHRAAAERADLDDPPGRAHGARGVPQTRAWPSESQPSTPSIRRSASSNVEAPAGGLAGRQGARCARACATRCCTTPSVVAAVRSQVNVSARSRAASPRRARSSWSASSSAHLVGHLRGRLRQQARSRRRRSTRAGRPPPAPRSASRTAPPPSRSATSPPRPTRSRAARPAGTGRPWSARRRGRGRGRARPDRGARSRRRASRRGRPWPAMSSDTSCGQRHEHVEQHLDALVGLQPPDVQQAWLGRSARPARTARARSRSRRA